MRLPRFRIRTLMIAVLATGIAMGLVAHVRFLLLTEGVFSIHVAEFAISL